MRILCLANSIKLGGRCIAGIELESGQWVRPVHSRHGGQFDGGEVRFFDGSEIDVLDIVEVDEERAVATPYHPEDIVVDNTSWNFVQVATAADRSRLRRLYVGGPDLLGNRESSIVPPGLGEAALRASLALVHVRARRLWLKKEHYDDKPKYKAAFYLGAVRYELSITDPIIRDRMQQLEDGEHPADAIGLPEELSLTISLSEPTPFDGRCYKLVAAIFPR